MKQATHLKPTGEILMLMQDGSPYSLREIQEATGMSEKQVRNVTYRLMESGMMVSKPVQYCVTPVAEKKIKRIKEHA